MGSILLISDIHADIGALDEILRLAYSDDFSGRYGAIEKVINLGDVLERGHDPGEVVDRMNELDNIESILGNHDEAFLDRIQVSGSDMESELAHEEYRRTGQYESFFRGMGKYYVDTKHKLYATHGGPIDPCAIVPSEVMGVEAWLYSQPWQRISDIGIRYMDRSGYHYLPRDAFDAVQVTFGGPGFVIVCGHDHHEAAYRQKGDNVDDILADLGRTTLKISDRQLEEKKLAMEKGANYLVRLGLAGPEGYRGCGIDRCFFGVFTEKKGERALYLLNFTPERGDLYRR
jgi:hypothetical protein